MSAQTTLADTIPPSQFEVAEGFEITIWATTPSLYNPTNFDVDSKGRLWVTEAVNYRNFRNEELGVSDVQGDRVVVLEDTDGDGKADSSHTFVRDPELIAPLGIGVIDNKIIVSCSPNVLIYTDVDRDLKFDPKVDKKEVFLTGFRGLDHDHSLHGIKAGPDGLWYFNVGNAGAHTVTDKSGWTLRAGSSYAGGTPHLTENEPGRKSDDGRVWVGGVAMRIRPDGTGLEPIGHNFRNVYEECLSSFGDVFHADNDDPPACRTTWLMEYGNAGFSSADGTRGWMIDQRPGQPVSVAEWRQEDPGTIPAGDVYGYGAPTGVAFGETGCFDSRFPNGLLLISESARGEIFSYEPKPQGAGFSLERSVFLKLKTGSLKQGWFRPSDIAIGADGAIYVSDWYDPGVGGHRMKDDTASGTIYRIAPKGFKPKNPSFDLSTSQGRVAALLSPATNVRSLGWTTIKNLGKKGMPEIKEILANPNPLLAARGVWLLPYAGEMGLEELKRVFKNENPQMRVAAFRSLRRAASNLANFDRAEQANLALSKAREAMAADPSPAVRREVAICLRDLPWEERASCLIKIAEQFDGWDRWYLEAIGIASEGNESGAYELLVENAGVDSTNWDRRLAGLAWRLRSPKSVEAIAKRAMTETIPYKDRSRMMTALAFIADKSAADAMLEIATEGPEDIQGMARWWGKNRDGNDWKNFELGKAFPDPPKFKKPKKFGRPRDDFALAGKPVFSEIGERVDIDIDIKGASRLYLVAERIKTDEEKTGEKPKWVKNPQLRAANATWLNPRLIGQSGATNLTSIEWTMAFCQGQFIADNGGKKPFWEKRIRTTLPVLNTSETDSFIQIQTRSIIAYDLTGQGYERFQTAALIDSKDHEAGEQIQFSVFLDTSPSGEGIPAAEEIVKIQGNASHGRALFLSKHLNCISCHSAAGFGGGVGPDLTAIAKKHGPTVLVEGIVNPSAAISMGFETMKVLTFDGQSISGLTVSAGDPIVLKDAEGKTHTLAKDDIDEMQSSKLSMMPEMKKQLTAQEIASLLAFLKEMEMD